MEREPGLKRFKISPSNDRFLIAETSSGIITIRTKKKKETFQRIGDLKNLTMEKGVRKTEKKKERKKEERNFHGTTIWTSIDPGRVPFPGEISARVWRRVSWVEVEWLRGKTRTGKSYALWFAVHSPLPPSTANLITSLVARDPVTLPLPSKPRVERKTIAPLSPRPGMSRLKDGAAGRPSYEFHLSRMSILRDTTRTPPRATFYDSSCRWIRRWLVQGLFEALFRTNCGDLFDRRGKGEDREICIKGF